jgi:hypothetical protein
MSWQDLFRGEAPRRDLLGFLVEIAHDAAERRRA